MLAADIALRPATADDALSIGVLATQVYLDTYAIDGIGPTIARDVLAQFSTPAIGAELAAATVTVAERGGRLVGFAQLVLDAARAGGAGRGAELLRLYVHPRFAGAGLGSTLLRHAEAQAAAHGATELWLTAWIGNRRALAFYARRGYFDVGRTMYVVEHERHENRILAKALPRQHGAGDDE